MRGLSAKGIPPTNRIWKGTTKRAVSGVGGARELRADLRDGKITPLEVLQMKANTLTSKYRVAPTNASYLRKVAMENVDIPPSTATGRLREWLGWRPCRGRGKRGRPARLPDVVIPSADES